LIPGPFLSAHDGYGLFDAVGDLVRTGPTLTNVNDLRAVLIASL
jgi:glycerate 2-kinase